MEEEASSDEVLWGFVVYERFVQKIFGSRVFVGAWE